MALFPGMKNTSTGEAGGCHLGGITPYSSHNASTRKYDVTRVGLHYTDYFRHFHIAYHCRLYLIFDCTVCYNL